MKKVIFASVIAAAVLAACNGGSKPSETTAVKEASQAGTEATTYDVDVAASKLGWTASKVSGTHNGTVNIKSGSLSVQGGKLVAGSFIIDMTSIIDLDLKPEDGKEKLEAHLRGTGDAATQDHFFNTSKYPEAKFEITGVTELSGNPDATHEISGNLTIKDKTHGLKFPAKVEVTETGAKASAKIVVDRSLYGITYNNKQSIGDKAKDNVINDNFELVVDLTAHK